MLTRYPILDLPAVALALTVWLWSAWPSAHGAPPPPPTAPVLPPAATCGANLVLEAALPAPSGRGSPERLWLRNLEPTTVLLDGFHVTNGRQRRQLAPFPHPAHATDTMAAGTQSTNPALLAASILPPGALVELRPPRLRNTDGRVTLIDPCGLILSELTWDDVPHDAVVLAFPDTHAPDLEPPYTHDADWRDKTASVMVPSQQTSRSYDP